jgi:DNA gyrase/topoisomerase IV subunit A
LCAPKKQTGVLALIDDPTLPHERLLRLVPAPDFPTGGLIMGLDGAAKMYTTGGGGEGGQGPGQDWFARTRV